MRGPLPIGAVMLLRVRGKQGFAQEAELPNHLRDLARWHTVRELRGQVIVRMVTYDRVDVDNAVFVEERLVAFDQYHQRGIGFAVVFVLDERALAGHGVALLLGRNVDGIEHALAGLDVPALFLGLATAILLPKVEF